MWQWVDVTRAWKNMAGDWSFTKLLITAIFIAKFHSLTALIIIALLAAAFGKSTFEGFVQRGSWNTNESVTENITRILARRVTAPGAPPFEPAP